MTAKPDFVAVAAGLKAPALRTPSSGTSNPNARNWLAPDIGRRGGSLVPADATLQMAGGLAEKGTSLQSLALFRQDQLPAAAAAFGQQKRC